MISELNQRLNRTGNLLHAQANVHFEWPFECWPLTTFRPFYDYVRKYVSSIANVFNEWLLKMQKLKIKSLQPLAIHLRKQSNIFFSSHFATFHYIHQLCTILISMHIHRVFQLMSRLLRLS